MALIMGEGRVLSARLSMPAVPASLRLARLTASSLAADLDWSLDDIEDLRVAVDELTATVIDGADDALLELEYSRKGDGLMITGSCAWPAPINSLDPLARELLELTADRFSLAVEDGCRVFTLEKAPEPTPPTGEAGRTQTPDPHDHPDDG